MTLSREATHDNGDDASDPLTWDAWTDEWNWVPSLPYDEDIDFALDESAALSAAAIDALSRAMIPSDAVDRLLHFGSDPEWCICTRCVLARTERFLD